MDIIAFFLLSWIGWDPYLWGFQCYHSMGHEIYEYHSHLPRGMDVKD